VFVWDVLFLFDRAFSLGSLKILESFLQWINLPECIHQKVISLEQTLLWQVLL
jgi:histidyl-tRNA synthetase